MDQKTLLEPWIWLALARRCDAIIVGICVIYAPSRTEFGRGMAVEKGSYEKVKKFMKMPKPGLLKTALSLMKRSLMGMLDIIL